jgi:murein tripeptide amidase MpaA
MAYLNTDDVEDVIISKSNTYSSLSKIIELPKTSVEGRKIHAIIIGKNKDNKLHDSILFTGGMHAREWGTSDICVSFASDILEAYSLNTGLRYGNKYFNAEQIKKIVDKLNLIILPDVNPDGKAYSQSDPTRIMWRGNRHLENPSCFGVDLNRNFDFLWDFRKYFSPKARIQTSDDPCDPWQRYRGTSAFSEPETQNIKFLMDEYDGMGHHIDIHGVVGEFYHNWGDDENQSSDPEMNFDNSVYDRKRGVNGSDEYAEYISHEDLNHVTSLSKTFQDAVYQANNNKYKVTQAFDLYCTSGASDDYSYSRHFRDHSKKICGFTVEFGVDEQSFQPPWNKMEKYIVEVSSGLVAFCYAVSEELQ